MNIATQIEAHELTLGELAREALAGVDGDTEKATDILTKRLMKDRPLLRSVIHGAIRDAVSYRTELAMRENRRRILHAVSSPPPAPGRDSVISLAAGIRESLLDMPLAGGLRLRDATREQVSDQANRYAALAKDTGHKARWLSLIAQSVPDGKVVGDVMNDERAAELFREAA